MNEMKLKQAMDSLGYREKLNGTGYIREGVRIVCRAVERPLMKQVYPGIAGAAGARSAAAVERAMRGATEDAVSRPGWLEAWRELGGVNEPTNAEVIYRLARECRDDG